MPYKCKEAKKALDKAYREANKEKIAATRKVYNQANKEKIVEYTKVYYQANKEKLKDYSKDYYHNNKEKCSLLYKKYYQANKTKVIAEAAKYRALKIVQIPTHLRDCPIEKKRLYQTYKLCALFTKITGVQHHVDHMWPLSDGGPHWSGNLQIITATENMSKNSTVDPNIKATIQEMLKDIKDAY